MKILVIEDTLAYRLLLLKWLQRWGHEMFVAEDGLSGIVAYQQNRPDLVLLDIVMPGIDGLETARRLRALGGDWVPIIYISTNDSPEDIGAAIEAGGDDYLIKPLNQIVLAAKLLAMERIVAMKALMSSTLPEYIDLELQKLTELDNITRLANSYGLERGLAREYARCGRTKQPISAILAQVAEWPSQIENQRALKLAALFKSQIGRAPDLIAHLGDGSFILVLPDTPLTGALVVAQSLILTIEEISSSDQEPASVLQLGIATVVPATGLDHGALLEKARAALDEARREGKTLSSVESAPFRLTPRELECLQWCALGKSTWDIAQLLGISEAAVNFHMTNIRGKCGVASRQLAVAQAIQYGLIRNR